MAKFASAKKTPRFPNYAKRANSKCNTTRIANRYIHKMSDEEVRRVHGSTEEREAFIAEVKENLPSTRQTTKFLRKKKMILIMGREAYNDRKLHLNNVCRRLFDREATPDSPRYDQSPQSINNFVNDAIEVDSDDFDPVAAAAAFFNGIESPEIQYVFEQPQQEDDIIILVPVESPPRVPIEEEPVQPVGAFNNENAFKVDDDTDAVLDNQINIMEEQAMSPPDYWGHVLLNEEE